MKNKLSLIAAPAIMGFSAIYAQNRPNIIYIFTDQQTASAMSCSGNTDRHTPNMDRLMEEGVRLVNAYCATPLSNTSWYAMRSVLYLSVTHTTIHGIEYA